MLSWVLIVILAGGAQSTVPGYGDQAACETAGNTAHLEGLERANSIITAGHLDRDMPIATMAIAGLYFGPVDFYCVPGPEGPG